MNDLKGNIPDSLDYNNELFDQNCPVDYWKRDLRIPQNLRMPDLIRITKAFDSRRQLKVLKRKFPRS